MQYFFYIKHILLSNIPDFKKKSCILSFVVGKRRLSGIIHLLCLPSVYSFYINFQYILNCNIPKLSDSAL